MQLSLIFSIRRLHLFSGYGFYLLLLCVTKFVFNITDYNVIEDAKEGNRNKKGRLVKITAIFCFNIMYINQFKISSI